MLTININYKQMERKGVKDIMVSQRYRPTHVRDALLKSSVPGNWKSLQNVYNLVSGSVNPKDPYVFIVLSNLLNVDIRDIIIRYSNVGGVISDNLNIETSFEDSDIEW